MKASYIDDLPIIRIRRNIFDLAKYFISSVQRSSSHLEHRPSCVEVYKAYNAAPRAAAKVGSIVSLILTTSGESSDIKSLKVPT